MQAIAKRIRGSFAASRPLLGIGIILGTFISAILIPATKWIAPQHPIFMVPIVVIGAIYPFLIRGPIHSDPEMSISVSALFTLCAWSSLFLGARTGAAMLVAGTGAALVCTLVFPISRFVGYLIRRLGSLF